MEPGLPTQGKEFLSICWWAHTFPHPFPTSFYECEFLSECWWSHLSSPVPTPLPVSSGDLGTGPGRGRHLLWSPPSSEAVRRDPARPGDGSPQSPRHAVCPWSWSMKSSGPLAGNWLFICGINNPSKKFSSLLIHLWSVSPLKPHIRIIEELISISPIVLVHNVAIVKQINSPKKSAKRVIEIIKPVTVWLAINSTDPFSSLNIGRTWVC